MGDHDSRRNALGLDVAIVQRQIDGRRELQLHALPPLSSPHSIEHSAIIETRAQAEEENGRIQWLPGGTLLACACLTAARSSPP